MEAYDPDTVFSSIDLQGRYCLQQSAARRTLEPDASRRSIAARSRQEEGSEEAALASAYEALAAFAVSSKQLTSPVCAANLASSPNARATRRWPRTCWNAWPSNAPTSP